MLAVFLAATGGNPAEEVEVTADSAKVKIADRVIASVKRGSQFTVLEREGPWVAVAVDTADEPREGWILANRVRNVVDEGINEHSRR